MKNMSLLKILLLTFICLTISMYAEQSEYLFHQQYNDTCYILPILNLHRLDRILKEHSDLLQKNRYNFTKLPWHEWNTRREWFGINYKYFYNWLYYFEQIEKKKNGEYKELYNYLVNGIKHGPTLPHFYNKNGDIIFTPSEKAKEDARYEPGIQFALSPYFFQDYGALQKSEKVFNFFNNAFEESDTAWEVIDSLQTNPNTHIPFAREKNGTYVAYDEILGTFNQVTVKNINNYTQLLSNPDTDEVEEENKSGTPPIINKNLIKKNIYFEYTIDFNNNVTFPENFELDVWSKLKYKNLNKLGSVIMKSINPATDYKAPMGFYELAHLLKLPLGISTESAYGAGYGANLSKKQTPKTTFAPYEMGLCKLICYEWELMKIIMS